jgi:hypothetical protein
MTISDRRFRPRFPYHARGILILLPHFVDVTIIDMSLSGAHIIVDGSCKIKAGQVCSLRIVNSDERQVIEVEATMAYHRESHVGLALRNVTPGIETALRKVVEMNLGTEPMLKRDLCALLHPLRSQDSYSS